MERKNNMYNEKVMDHFYNPRNVGVIEDADAIGEVGNARCGDIMQIFLKIDNDVITDIKFQTFGCGAAIASTSMGTEMVKGKTLEEALKIKNSDVLDELGGLPKEKIHCSVLFEEVLKDAISKYKESK